MKVCSRCKLEQPPSDFSPSGRYTQSWCKRCCADHASERWAAGAAERERVQAEKKAAKELARQQPRTCARCEKVKEPGAFRGTRNTCYVCEQEVKNAKRRANPEPGRAYAREYHRQHREKRAAYTKRRRQEHPEAISATFRRYYIRNLERMKQRRRNYWANLTAEQKKAYLDRNRHSYLEHDARRRAQKRGSAIGPVDRRSIVERDNSTCYLCGRKLTDREIHLDHVIPLARGGSHTADNLKVTCRPCNQRKSDKLLEELPWYNKAA